MKLVPAAATVLVLALPACLSPRGPSLAEMYAASREESGNATDPEEQREVEQRRRERIELVRGLIRGEALASLDDHLYAAAILLDSNTLEDLELAAALPLTAAERGDDRGFPLAAEAIDRALLLQRRPQKYGTQYVFQPLTGRWELYHFDPMTTDAERRAMGVAPLSVALDRAARLNGDG